MASAGLHFRAFYLLTFAVSHDLKETIDKDYCECGMPLETVRESEAPLKERSERVSLSVVPLLLGGSDSLSVSYGMEPEQEALRM